jgi:HEAT repeat protein/energy-coupling factor transporter ATP-binding protein EcfA2
MDTKQKLNMLRRLDEKRLTKEILISLFENMGFKSVLYNHGVLEYGKDVIYREDTKFLKHKYVGVQVKKGDIDTKTADKLFCQVAEGLGDPFDDLSDNNKEKPIDEFIVLASGQIKQNARKSISKRLKAVHIDKPISFIEGPELVGLLDEYMPSAFWTEYDYFDKYFNAMKADFEQIKDISAIGQKEHVPLESIYVSLRVSEQTGEPSTAIEEEWEIFEDEREGKDRDREEKLRRDDSRRVLHADRAVRDHSKLVITGAPGSGKTTLLKYLALRHCRENLEKQERLCVPVPIVLRQLAESAKTVRAYIDEVFEKYQFPKARKFVEKDLKAGKCMLLLDGFDELATEQYQQGAADQVRAFVKKYPKCRVVVTSRTAGYHDELAGFTKLELMEFDDGQIKQFIDNWFGAGEPETAAKSIHDAIATNEQIKALARNPLMVAIIAIIYEEDLRLPKKRADLYERCVDVLLSKWDVQKRLKNVYPAEKKKFVLRKLAFYGHTNNKRIMTDEEVTAEILKYFGQVGLKEKDAKPFLDEIWQRSYLLRQISMTAYDFLHLSFQEYFTALELKETGEAGLAAIVEHVYEPWWEEPILLYAGLSRDASGLIKTIESRVPEDIFHSNLMLFGKCIADAEFTQPPVRDAIIEQLWLLYYRAEFEPLENKAIGVLAMIKPDKIVDSLIENLGDEKLWVRRSAVEALGDIGSDRAIEGLAGVLAKDRYGGVRWRAAEALGRIGSEQGVAPLLTALFAEDKDSYVRWRAAEALGRIGSEQAVAPLLEALAKEKDGGVRWRAAEALGRIGSEQAVAPLLEALTKDKNRYVRQLAAFALGSIGSARAVAPLLEALAKDKERYARGHAADALGRMGTQQAVAPLLAVLDKDKDRYVRGRAASALGNIGSEQGVAPLLTALAGDKDSFVRWRAASALGRIGSEQAVAPLLAALANGKHSAVRWSAAFALGRIGSEEAVVPLLAVLAKAKDSEFRGRAAEALGRIGSEQAMGPLKEALKDEGEYYARKVKDVAFAALERICRKHRIRITR